MEDTENAARCTWCGPVEPGHVCPVLADDEAPKPKPKRKRVRKVKPGVPKCRVTFDSGEPCQNHARQRGLCTTHLQREEKGTPLGAPLGTFKKKVGSPKTCTYFWKTGEKAGTQCTEPNYALGYCAVHRSRYKHGWDMDKPLVKRQRNKGKKCRHCEDPAKSLGLCELHHKRQQEGIPMDKPKPRPSGTRYMNNRPKILPKTGAWLKKMGALRGLSVEYVAGEILDTIAVMASKNMHGKLISEDAETALAWTRRPEAMSEL